MWNLEFWIGLPIGKINASFPKNFCELNFFY